MFLWIINIIAILIIVWSVWVHWIREESHDNIFPDLPEYDEQRKRYNPKTRQFRHTEETKRC
jgi:hypothetical protein